MALSPECPKGGFPKSCARQAADTMAPASLRWLPDSSGCFCRSAREISLPKERPTLDTSRLWVSRLWTNTRFVLQTSERCREYKTVIIALEFRAVVFPDLVIFFQSQPFVGYQLLPIHIHSCRFFTKVIKKVDIRSFYLKINGCVQRIGYFCTSKTIISTYNGSTCY